MSHRPRRPERRIPISYLSEAEFEELGGTLVGYLGECVAGME